jgi:hypothetical protein
MTHKIIMTDSYIQKVYGDISAISGFFDLDYWWSGPNGSPSDPEETSPAVYNGRQAVALTFQNEDSARNYFAKWDYENGTRVTVPADGILLADHFEELDEDQFEDYKEELQDSIW